MNIPADQIAYKKRVGTLNGNPVFRVTSKGGLNLVCIAKPGKTEIAGAGSHFGIAKFIAEKKEPDIKWTDLEKGDWLSPEDFAILVPKYDSLTDQLRKLQGA